MDVRHISIKFDVTARSRKGNSVKFSAYCACAKVRAADGKIFDFRRKKAELRGHAILLPDGAPTWAAGAELWRRAEAAEKRIDAQTSRIGRVEIPRQVPENLRLDFARYIAQPWTDDGMAVQMNVHCSEASDGHPEGNPHIHYMMSLRRFDGDDFAATKENQWNIDFRAKEPGSKEKGTAMRAHVAARANEWLEAHGIDVRVDHRRKNDGIPAERDISKKSWEAWKKDKESAAAAPVRQVLAARQMRSQLRQAKAAAIQFEAAARTIGRELDSRRPGLRAPARKQGFVWDSKWSPKVEGYIAEFEIHDRFAAIDLTFGNRIRDYGSRIVVTGKADWRAAMALAEHAERRGLKTVEITGSDPKFRAALAAQLAARGIEATNERKPSAHAIEQARELSAKAKAPQPVQVSDPVKPEAPKSKPRPPAPEPEANSPSMRPALIPPWARNPGWTASKSNNNDGGRSS